MTLIASFEVHGSPIMIGDLLLSSPGSAGPSTVTLPFWTLDNAQFHAAFGHTISGVAQKLIIIHEKLCIAWADSALQAAALIAHLRDFAAGKEEILDDDFMAAFHAYPAADWSQLQFIIHCRTEKGNRYLSNLPRFDVGDALQIRVGGSGTPHFYNWIEAAYQCSPTTEVPEGAEYGETAARALMYLGLAALHQGTDGTGVPDRWGGGFEALFYTPEIFFKPNLLWLWWNFEVTDEGIVAHLGRAPTMQYYIENVLYLWTFDAQTGDWYLHQITPPFQTTTALHDIPTSFGRYSAICPYRVMGEGGGSGVFVDLRGMDQEPRMVLIHDEHGTSVGCDPDLFHEWSNSLEESLGRIIEVNIWGTSYDLRLGAGGGSA